MAPLSVSTPATTRRSRAKSDRRTPVDRRGRTPCRRAGLSRGAAGGHRRRSGRQRARRSTGTSPTRRRCWSSCWWGSAPGCWPAPPPSSTRADDPADALDGLIDFHLDFALGESDLIRIQDRDLGHLPPTAKRQVRKAQRQYVEIWVDVLRQLDDDPQRGRRTADGARDIRIVEFDTTQRETRCGKTAEASSRAVLRAMTVAALTSAGRCRALVPDSPAADGPSDGSEDPEHRADDDQHDADIGQDRDAEYQPKDEQDGSQGQSWLLHFFANC